MYITKRFLVAVFAISTCLGVIAATPAQAQVDTSKHWYTTYFKANMPANPKSGCATAQIKFVFAPNMRANQLSAAPFGYTKAYDNSKPSMTRSAGGWCPKSMSASACEAREKLRWKNVWHNWALMYPCTTLRWNDVVVFSR